MTCRRRAAARRSARLALPLALAAGLLAGCGSSADDAPAQPGVTASGPTDRVVDLEPDEPSLSPGESASPAPFAPEDAGVRALAAAESVVENARAFELDRDDDGGEAGWTVLLAVGDREHEILVSADGNAVLGEGAEDALEDEDRTRLEGAPISSTEAAVAALTDVPGTVEQLTLDEENGTVVWEVEVRTSDGADVDVLVDATTGGVL
jgi:uncharacterized membrane protein YkoI